eukprot:9582-Heterococcus_DN1.PRE.2
MAETLSTVKFANRAKNIKNEAVVNEDIDQKSLLRKYEKELLRLRTELEARSQVVVSSREMMRLQQERDIAVDQRQELFRKLELQMENFKREKDQKRRLEQKIAVLTSQTITSAGRRTSSMSATNAHYPNNNNSSSSNNSGHAQSADTKNSNSNSSAYNASINAASAAGNTSITGKTASEEVMEVDKVRVLLMRQRDIIVALTQSLNARDEQVKELQNELDIYDKEHAALEDRCDGHVARLLHLNHLLSEYNATLSEDDRAKLAKALEGTGAANATQDPGQASSTSDTLQADDASSTVSEGDMGVSQLQLPTLSLNDVDVLSDTASTNASTSPTAGTIVVKRAVKTISCNNGVNSTIATTASATNSTASSSSDSVAAALQQAAAAAAAAARSEDMHASDATEDSAVVVLSTARRSSEAVRQQRQHSDDQQQQQQQQASYAERIRALQQQLATAQREAAATQQVCLHDTSA